MYIVYLLIVWLKRCPFTVRGFRGKEIREDDPNSDINLIETPYE